jgi:hypothetical protein
MATSAFVGDFVFERQNVTTSPISWQAVPECISISNLGQTNDLIDATHFGSGGSREYIPGLADGSEVSIECNYVQNNAAQEAFITDVKNKASRNFRVRVTDGSPETVFSFNAACLGWVINPAVDDRNTISFTVKVSGDITVA